MIFASGGLNSILWIFLVRTRQSENKALHFISDTEISRSILSFGTRYLLTLEVPWDQAVCKKPPFWFFSGQPSLKQIFPANTLHEKSILYQKFTEYFFLFAIVEAEIWLHLAL